MSLMDKIKEFFSGGSSADDHPHGHDHMGAGHESTVPPATEPAGMTAPSPAPGTVAMPEPMTPAEPMPSTDPLEPGSERRDET